MRHHLNSLRRGDHKNPHLQHAWNKYGEDNFEFSILEICSKQDTYIAEQKYLDKRDVDNSYNINPNDKNKDLNKLSEQGQNYIPSYVKNKEQSKMKPITLIGEKTQIGRLLEKYNFLRQNNFSLNKFLN